MPTVTVSKRFTVNMGNYESYSPEFKVELPLNDGVDPLDLFKQAVSYVDEAAYNDLQEAASLSDVRNTYVLTWLHNRKDEAYAQGNN